MLRSGLGLVLLFLGGCGASAVAAPPPRGGPVVQTVTSSDDPDVSTDTHDAACANSAEPSSADACVADGECALCHDGSACGTAVTLASLSTHTTDCNRPDTRECESLVVRCCSGHCRYVAF